MASRLRALVAALALIAIPAVSSGLASILTPDQIHPGDKAVVRTVFQGDRIEDFDAEIVGVLKGGRVEGDMIVARATSERVRKTGIAQGMSGSPVYVDGKLVGALSGGWSFTREPVFVVTPIREMLEVLDQPAGDAGDAAGTAGPAGIEAGARSAFGEFRWGEPVPPEPAPPQGPWPPAVPDGSSGALVPGAPTRLALPVSCAGLDPSLFPMARQLLEPLGFTAVPGGSPAQSAHPAPFEPGSAVAVELMRGDLRLSAIGTVTWREGDRVLIFGHPFFQSGRVRLPLASASITTIVASDLTSFKLGSAGRPVGTAVQDRRTAVSGIVGPSPRLMPVSVAVSGTVAPRRSFHFESIEDRALAPQLISLAALNSLLESGGTGANQTLRWSLVLHRKGVPPLTISNVVVSENPSGDIAGGLGAPLRFLYNNPFTRLALDSVAVRLETSPGRDLWSLRAAQILDAAVRPGGTVRVRCEIERWRGEREAVTLALHMPEEVPPGRYVLWVGGGPEWSHFEAARLPGRYRPASLDEAWRRLADFHSSDRLYASLLARAPEITRDGRDYPELPASALPLLAGAQSAEDATRRGIQAILDQVARPFAGEVRGELQLEVDVDPQAP